MKRIFAILLLLLAFSPARASIVFNETGERYQWLSNSLFTIPTTGSIAMWIYPNWAHTDNVGHQFFAHDTQSTTCGANRFYFTKASDNSFIAGWYESNVQHSAIATSGNYSLTQSAWNHVAVTWDDSANETRLYVNGTEVANQTSTLVTYTAQSPFVGSWRCTTGQTNPDANVGEIGVWSRVLTAAEVLQHATRFSALFLPKDLYAYVKAERFWPDAGSRVIFRLHGGSSNEGGVADSHLAGVSCGTTFACSDGDHLSIFYPRNGLAQVRPAAGAVGAVNFYRRRIN